MDWNVFFSLLAAGIWLVVIQGIFAWIDWYLTQEQLHARGVTSGWSFLQHGGMWADLFIISPIVAYTASRYELQYFDPGALFLLASAIMLTLIMGVIYQRNGMITPEAHTHDGKTTIAGWIHGFFAVVAIWICGMLFFGMTKSPVSHYDLIAMAVLLTLFFDLGVRKFSVPAYGRNWFYDTPTRLQVLFEIAALWAVTFARIRYS